MINYSRFRHSCGVWLFPIRVNPDIECTLNHVSLSKIDCRHVHITCIRFHPHHSVPLCHLQPWPHGTYKYQGYAVVNELNCSRQNWCRWNHVDMCHSIGTRLILLQQWTFPDEGNILLSSVKGYSCQTTYCNNTFKVNFDSTSRVWVVWPDNHWIIDGWIYFHYSLFGD